MEDFMMSKKKRPPANRKRAVDRKLRDGLERADWLIERRRWPEAHAWLDDLCRTYPQRPVILRRLVEVAVAQDDAHTYQFGCEKLLALCPREPDLPHMLAVVYLRNGFLALAREMGRRALSRHPASSSADKTRAMLADLEQIIHLRAAEMGLDGADGVECLAIHDRVRSLLAMGHYARALEAAEQLLQRRPRFTPAYNNAAEACFHDGRLPQAIALVQRLLAFDPDNVFALANLVRFLCLSAKADEARRHADRLKSLMPAGKTHAIKQAEALTWLGDDAGVLAVFAKSRPLPVEEGPHDDALLYHLAAVAELRQGQEEQARGYWRSALNAAPELQLARENLDDLGLPAGERNAPWSYSFSDFVPKKLVGEMLTDLAPFWRRHGAEGDRPEAEPSLASHPELEGLVPLLLDKSNKEGRELALRLAGLFRTPAMLQAVRDFALGRRGSDSLRMRAAHLADAAGLLPAGPMPLWFTGEPRNVALSHFEVHGEPIERTHAPGVADLVKEGRDALNAGNFVKAERALARALALDPDDPVALNNLAQIFDAGGRRAECEALMLRLQERHPDYLFGRTAQASLAATRGDFDRARRLLEPVLARKRFHFSEFAALCLAQVNLLVAEGKHAPAQSWLDLWRQTIPDHPLLEQMSRRVRELPHGR
jgi:tetratricopeptide (TPR) repeat protein